MCGDASASVITRLARYGVQVLPVEAPSTGYERPMKKALAALRFRVAAWRIIDRFRTHPLLWIFNAETAIVLGRRLFSYRYVLHAYELPERYTKQQFAQSFFRRATHVVCPESNRAAILRTWYRLRATPSVVPNTPMVEDESLRQKIADTQVAQRIKEIAATRRIALYQGMISPDRSLTGVARAFAAHARNWSLVLMGRDYGQLDELRKASPDIVHIPHIDAPDHLAVTSWANLGIIVYNYVSLNNIYCAPNKIYEYGAFSLPVLANDVPGLQAIVQQPEAGLCCDSSDVRDIVKTISKIESRYDTFRRGVRSVYTEALANRSAIDIAESVAKEAHPQREQCTSASY